jgi:hypothetical protein
MRQITSVLMKTLIVQLKTASEVNWPISDPSRSQIISRDSRQRILNLGSGIHWTYIVEKLRACNREIGSKCEKNMKKFAIITAGHSI